jgi:hypothetical protein
MVRLLSVLAVVALFASCGPATTAGGTAGSQSRSTGRARPPARGKKVCFVSDPKNIYRRVSVCLTPADGNSGRFTFGESRTVPDATLGRSCEGRFVRKPGTIELQIESCTGRTVAHQRGTTSTTRSRSKETIHVSVQTPRKLVLRTGWGETVPLLPSK